MTKHFKITIDPKVLSLTEWPVFIPPPSTTYPVAYRIEDGACKVYFALSFYMWLSKEQFKHLHIEEDTEEIPPAPTVGFSEGFILRALAIAQDPKLAKELV